MGTLTIFKKSFKGDQSKTKNPIKGPDFGFLVAISADFDQVTDPSASSITLLISSSHRPGEQFIICLRLILTEVE